MLMREIARVGVVKIKMFDGSIHTSQGVWHVKGLKNNLLFIEHLDDLRCKTHIESEILKFVKGSLLVMKVENITKNLYILLGDTL